MIEPDNLQFISPLYQCEKAINAYYSTIYTHKQGHAYKNLIENMYYLNDDFNDELYHFSIAMERFKISNNFISDKIKRLKTRARNSDIYQHINYIKE